MLAGMDLLNSSSANMSTLLIGHHLPPPPHSHMAASVNSTADMFLGWVLIMCMVVGIPSNLLSFFYFTQRANKSVHNTLYTVVTITDTVTLATAFAPISVLISDTERSAMLFGNPRVCKSWTMIFYFTLRYTLFTVMMISVSRTISIKAPFHIINRVAVAWTCAMYAIWLLAKDFFFIRMAAVDPKHYDEQFASSIYYYNSTETLGVAFLAFGTLEIVLVTITNVINFIISLVFLIKKPTLKAGVRSTFHSVSVTITIFTAVSLTCTLPLIIVLFLQLFGVYRHMTAATLSYVRFISHVFLIMVNAALNPFIYVLRMPAYRTWFGLNSARVPRTVSRIKEGKWSTKIHSVVHHDTAL